MGVKGTIIKIGKKAHEHLPEILTGASIGCVIGGDVLLWRATKKETEDGDKKHYILPILVTSAGIVCIVLSNRVSNAQKISIAAAASALAVQNLKQRQALEKNLTPEELAKFDEIDRCLDGGESGQTLYYMPDFGIKFWSTEGMIDKAEIYANKFFDGDGFVSLEDILEFLKAMPPKELLAREDEALIKNVYYAYDWDSDEEQGLIFERMPTNLLGVDCVRLKIKQFGGKFSTFQ